MGFWKYGARKQIVKTYKDLNELINDLEERGFSSFRRRLASIEPIKLEPERYLYMRNLSVTAEEWHGPNENGDGFPYEELEHNHMSFIGSRSPVDHQDDIIVGMVLDSVLLPPQFDEKKKFVNGGFVENILAIDRKMVANSRFPKLIDWIEEEKVTDTSMGAHVGFTRCSICGNIATDESEYCEHVMPSNGFKGTIIKTSSGEEKLCYESCRDVTFFEDSIIIPLHLGGLAGGEGADTNAKFLEKVATYPITNYIIDRKKQIEIVGQEKENEEEKEDIYSAALDYIFAEEKKGVSFIEALRSAVEAFNLDSKLFEKTFSSKRVYITPLKKYGIKTGKIGEYNTVMVDGKILVISDQEIV